MPTYLIVVVIMYFMY